MRIGCFCTCLSFQAETAHRTGQTMLHNYLQTIVDRIYLQWGRPVHNRWFQFQLSLLKADYELWGFLLFTEIPTFSSCHDPLVRPPPTQFISPISVKTGSGTDRSFQQGRAHSSGLCPPSPTGLYSPPAPVPLPPLSLSAPSHGASGVSWNIYLIFIIVCAF